MSRILPSQNFCQQFRGPITTTENCTSVLQEIRSSLQTFWFKAYLPASVHRKLGTRLNTICEALHDRALVRRLGRCLFLITCVIFTRKQAVGKPANHQNVCYQWKAGKTLPMFCCLARHSPTVTREVNVKGIATKRDTWSTKYWNNEK